MAKAIQLAGDKKLLKKLRKLGPKIEAKVLRQSLNAAATPVVKTARAEVSVDEGLLKKAIGKKTKVKKGTGFGSTRVGARSNIVGTDEDGNRKEPWRYSHLVELGHINADGTHTPPRPFLRPAGENTKDAQLAAMKDKLASGIRKEALRG